MIEHIVEGKLPFHIKACIALTSWKARIDTVGMTIFNLLHMCGHKYHIVLTLSEDEFPNKELDLPNELRAISASKFVEIIWVKHNWRSFKKWLFCGLRYPSLPIISADDDCIYTCNYADKLYQTWINHKTSIITNNGMPMRNYGIQWGRGPNTLYPPQFTKLIASETNLKKIEALLIQDISEDDSFYGCVAHANNISYIDLGADPFYVFHNTKNALSKSQGGYNYQELITLYKAMIAFNSKG